MRVDDDKARSLLADSIPFSEAARQLGVSQACLHRWEKRHGLKFRRVQSSQMNPEKRTAIINLIHTTDLTNTQIARLTNSSFESVACVRAREPVEIPAWVPPSFRQLYTDVAQTAGECEAASIVRAAKRNTHRGV